MALSRDLYNRIVETLLQQFDSEANSRSLLDMALYNSKALRKIPKYESAFSFTTALVRQLEIYGDNYESLIAVLEQAKSMVGYPTNQKIDGLIAEIKHGDSSNSNPEADSSEGQEKPTEPETNGWLIVNGLCLFLLSFFSIWLLSALVGPENNQAVLATIAIIATALVAIVFRGVENRDTMQTWLQQKWLLPPLFIGVMVTGLLCWNWFIIPRIDDPTLTPVGTLVASNNTAVAVIQETTTDEPLPATVVTDEPHETTAIPTSVSELTQTTPEPIVPNNMILIAAGTYPFRLPDGSLSTVTIPTFAIDSTEVSRTAFRAYLDNESPLLDSEAITRLSPNATNSDLPMTNISYDEALDYCKAYGKFLPDATQWQIAAGWNPATDTLNIYPWGNEADANRANIEARTDRLLSVTTFATNALGLYHMAGNAAEWVLQARDNEYRALGGHYRSSLDEVRIGQAGLVFDTPLPEVTSERIGFRCIWTG